jgi:hypothetical protein
MLERVVLRLDEDVEAQDRLEERRVGVRDAFDGRGRKKEADCDRISSFAKKLTR